MDCLRPPTPVTHHGFHGTSFFTTNFSFRTCNWRNPDRFHKRLSFSFCSPFYATTRLRVSAQFGRSTTRRNWLRKKLLEDQKVRLNPTSLNPSPDPQVYHNVEILGKNLSGHSENQRDSCYNVVDSSNLGESALLVKLENWVEQYKKDAEFWGIGPTPIFTVFQGLDGNVERVVVDEDEILSRSPVGSGEFEDLREVNSKILYARSLAQKMEKGESVISRNSTIVKFVSSTEKSDFTSTIGVDNVIPRDDTVTKPVSSSEKSDFTSSIRGVVLSPNFVPKLLKFGSIVLCGLIVFGAVKKLLSFGNKEEQLTEQEEETLENPRVEVVQESPEPPIVSFKKPKLDKGELMNSILKAKGLQGRLAVHEHSSSQTTTSVDFDNRIKEIREMARKAHENEGMENSLAEQIDEKRETEDEKLSNEIEMVGRQRVGGAGFLIDISDTKLEEGRVIATSTDEPKGDDTKIFSKVGNNGNENVPVSSIASIEISKDQQSIEQDLMDDGSNFPAVIRKEILPSNATDGELCISKSKPKRMKRRVIRSVEEAREFLVNKRDKQGDIDKTEVNDVQNISGLLSAKRLSSNTGQRVSKDRKVSDVKSEISEYETARKSFTPKDESIPSEDFYSGDRDKGCGEVSISVSTDSEVCIPKENESGTPRRHDSRDAVEGCEGDDKPKPPTSLSHEINGSKERTRHPVKAENWIEKNFHEVEPILKKIGDGFRENYMVARERANEPLDMDLGQLISNANDGELEWMNDENLREIVFQVRENELMGKDPFHLIADEDKLAFFKGLEKKVEKDNEKLSHLHNWLHSNIENLDYGADGISLYDPPEKIIPRWKGPPLEKNPEFLNNFEEQRKAIFAGKTDRSYPAKKDEQNFLQKSTESIGNGNVARNSANQAFVKGVHDRDPKGSKTVIEGSDGTVRSGKKSGKEYWQHTKKWSRGFLESYNAETDPEVKSSMKEMGKDLDRWITEEEIQESADLMSKLPERNKEFMEKKLNKLKREMELFGPQAVVSKYREYADDKEQDYLWWLDLPHVLCIELYTTENEEQKIGFYSLEMAADLELEPKPYHVIAFEDAGDCKNLCYIIQAHMDMLGNGHAFVVARPPKDAFREAKANGFGVTVIRKGELPLNIDQTLEEVEEQVTEIGSKIYHDKITQERSVDTSAIMKGVFGVENTTRRKRSKRKLKNTSRKGR
ncbi:uncharacterized protein LOC119983305 [Tripterygium wilfordii]|uniref:uncharacterized protein LOC119983305 n=1 Tax=Tripterygium wilfordii TaxID=458696 RepID=UPI0018F846E6|nr:uncharacterized protein LOC119983305 [Tripterygium wilfordii]